jgi:excisionase family DNA binding protein
MKEGDQADIMTLSEVCDLLKLSDKTVYSLVPELKGFKLANKWRFKRTHIDEYIQSQIDKGSKG